MTTKAKDGQVEVNGLRVRRERSRLCSVELKTRAADGTAQPRTGNTFRVAMSSEQPVLSWDYNSGAPFWEVLGHRDGEVVLDRMNAGASIRDGHYGPQIGKVDSPEVADSKLYADAQFMRTGRGAEVEEGVLDNIVQNVSVGYDVLGYMPDGAGEDGIPRYRAIWEPYHMAIVPDPADITVGFRERRVTPTEAQLVTVAVRGAQPKEGQAMLNRMRMHREGEGAGGPGAAVSDTPAAGAGERAAHRIDVAEERNQAVAAERERCSGIEDLCAAAGIEAEQMREWRDKGLTIQTVAKNIREATKTKGKPQPGAEAIDQGLGLSERDAGRYSFTRALRMSASMFPGGGAAEFKREKFDGLEAEVHQELERYLPPSAARHHGGVLIPWRLRDVEKAGARERQMHERALRLRAMGASVAGGGAELVPEVLGELIDFLRPSTVLYQAGARIITGLSAPVSYPVKTQALTGYWTSENPPSPVTPSEMKFGSRMLSPRTMMVADVLPRQLLVQSSIDMEAESRRDMADTIALMLDRGGLHGPGTGGQVLGLFNTPGVGVSDNLGGVATFKDYLKIPALAAEATFQNPLGAQSWLTTIGYASALAGTPKESGFPVYLWPTDPGTIDASTLVGYPARSTTQISSTLKRADGSGTADHHGLVFGPFGQCVFGLFGAVEVVADPYTLAGYGQIAMTYFQLADFLCRYPQAFVIADGAKP